MSATPAQAHDATWKRWMVWAGWALGAVALFVLLSSARWKLTANPWYVGEWKRIGYSPGALPVIGLLQLTCVILYLIPPTAVLGTVLLTGYLGGAIATYIRIGEPYPALVPLSTALLLCAEFTCERSASDRCFPSAGKRQGETGAFGLAPRIGWSRRRVMRRAGLLVTIVVVGIAVAGVVAQQVRIPPTGAIRKVRDNLYVIPGAGGNTTVFVTQSGVVLVDTKLANNGKAILDQVRTVSDKPVSMIVNTHSHPDHTGSNDYFPAAVEKVTHENTRMWMAANPKTGTNPAVMPTRTFTDRMTLGTGTDQIDLYYFGAGHTNGDAFVVFTALRAMCIGDLMAWKMAPLIDPATGGSVIALPDTLEKAMKGIPNVDTVIEGHGDVNTWAGFRDYTQFNRALLDAATAGLGKQTPEEIAASLKTKFPVFTKEEVLPDLEYGGTPLSRAVINVNVAFKELRSH